MHILIIASWYKSRNAPNAGSFIEEQARMLQRAGHEVSVLHAFLQGTFKDTLKGVKTVYTEENDHDIFTMRLGVNVIFPKMRLHSYMRLCKKSKPIVEKYIQVHGKPDVVHSHAMFMGGVVARYLGGKLDIPFFHTEHTSGFVINPEQYLKNDIYLASKVYEESNKTFFVSNYALKETRRTLNIPIRKGVVLSNVVNPLFYNQIKVKNSDVFNFIHIANMLPRKNWVVIIDAWSVFLKNYSENNYRLILVGAGPLKEQLLKKMKDLKLSDSIDYYECLNREEICQIMAKSHVLLSASSVETFGLTVAEANALGLPVIVSNSGGVLDIVNDQTGVIVEKISDEAFAESMGYIVENYQKYDSEKIREITRAKFSEEVILRKLEAEYKQVIKEYIES